MRSFPLFLLFLLALVSCAKDRTEVQVVNPITVPQDQASDEERAQINGSLEKFESLASELGKPANFRKVSIIVINDNDSSVTANPAACVTLNTVPQFIVLKHKVLNIERAMGPDAVESTLFRVLLHELGHCEFGRQHDDARIKSPRMKIELSSKRAGHVVKFPYVMLDSSIMASDSLTVPVELEKYYVAELLGLARASELADLKEFVTAKFIPEQTENPTK